MPGTELFGAEERKEIEDVLSTGIMFRFNHDAQRNNIWKAKACVDLALYEAAFLNKNKLRKRQRYSQRDQIGRFRKVLGIQFLL